MFLLSVSAVLSRIRSVQGPTRLSAPTSSSAERQSSTASKMLPQCIYQTIWLLLHALFRALVSVRRRWLDTVGRVAARLDAPATPAREQQLIELVRRCDLSKVPAHVAVVLNAQTLDDTQTAATLAQLVRWTEAAGCGHLSFYDYRGNIEQLRPQLYAAINAYQRPPASDDDDDASSTSNESRQTNGTSRAAANGNGRVHAMLNGSNGHSNGNGNGTGVTKAPHRICVHFIGARRNRSHLVDVTRELCVSRAAVDVNVSCVEERVAAALRPLPEPELALYFDAQCCTYGLSPWQTRLTEFVRLERSARAVRVGSFVRALRKYAKCEQRFGK